MWTVLYIAMAVAAFRIVRLGLAAPGVKSALALFAVQLALNLLWTTIFFQLQMRGLAFLEIIVLLAMIYLTTAAFFRLDAIAGWLMVPYGVWVAFAAVLNLTIWLMNR